MANANAPFGLRPINENGTPWSGQGKLIAFASGNSNNLFLGDPLVPVGGGDGNGVPYMTIATAGAGNVVSGGFIGMSNGPAGSGYTLTRDLPVYRQASIANYGFICDDPNQLYAIMEDSVGGAMAAGTAPSDNADLVAGSGSTVSGFSGWMLDSSTVGTGATKQLRILGLLRGPNNAIGNFAVWVCRLNLPALWSTTGI